MTDNVQLQNYINKNKKLLTNRNFLGVFASDELPVVNSHNACCIVNYSPHNVTDRGHWCAMLDLNTPNKSAYWFDSYGFAPDADDATLGDKTHFSDFLIKNSSTGHYDYNKFDYQAYGRNETECGEYASTALLENLGQNPNSKIFAKLRNLNDSFERDKYIREYCKIIPWRK